MQITGYFPNVVDLPHSFAILTDRRNIALAVNTNDFPGTEVRMWYNPDVMENRQRAIFMAGCDYLLPELVSMAVGVPYSEFEVTCEDDTITITSQINDTCEDWIDNVLAFVVDSDGNVLVDEEVLDSDNGHFLGEFDGNSVGHTSFSIVAKTGNVFQIK